ncbi:MAG: T9SS type A sorting domain-containing protein, partial [Ignavibacteriaceae bacterium]|nr:T9SS type A sorting domain-containing protein [Ignavibacteriaceae bacterium]
VSSYELLGIYFANSSTGWVSGEYLGVPHVASISKTTDGGITWNTQSFGTDEYLTDIYFVDEMTGWAVGGSVGGSGTSTILHTTDGGENWVAQTSPTTNALYGLSFADTNHGWAVGFDGTIIHTDNAVPVELEQPLPAEFSLNQNYPNPFNPSTTIEYIIPESGNVKLVVYNSIGEEVTTLVNNYKEAGNYKINFYAAGLPSGLYLYKLSAGNFSAVKKMVILK